MKEFVNKLIGRLEEKIHLNPIDEFDRGYSEASCDAIDDINELAEEYINTSTDTSSGWLVVRDCLI